MSRYVGVDLHRRRCWVVVLDGDGQVVSSVSVDNREPGRLVEAVAIGGEGCGVVIEAAWGWYWIADLLSDAGFVVHLAHPLGVAGFRNRRVKNDERDAILLADLLRMGSLPEAWIAPPELRELRELVRYRRIQLFDELAANHDPILTGLERHFLAIDGDSVNPVIAQGSTGMIVIAHA